MKNTTKIADADINRITSEVVKHMKQFIDEEIDIRVKIAVKNEVQRIFRELGRM